MLQQFALKICWRVEKGFRRRSKNHERCARVESWWECLSLWQMDATGKWRAASWCLVRMNEMYQPVEHYSSWTKMHVSVLKPEHFDVESHQHPKIMLCSICDLFYPLMTLVLLIQSSYSAPALIQEWIGKKELRSPVRISKLMFEQIFFTVNNGQAECLFIKHKWTFSTYGLFIFRMNDVAHYLSLVTLSFAKERAFFGVFILIK